MGALIHKDQNKKLLTKETKINDEFNSPNTEKWIHEYEIDTYPEGQNLLKLMRKEVRTF